MKYNSKIRVTRKVKGAKDETGSSTSAVKTILDNFPCDIQEDSSTAEIVSASQGQTPYYKKVIFCDKADIKLEDIIVDLESGVKYQVYMPPYIARSFGNKLEVRVLGGIIR